jgi:hypothetical protein
MKTAIAFTPQEQAAIRVLRRIGRCGAYTIVPFYATVLAAGAAAAWGFFATGNRVWIVSILILLGCLAARGFLGYLQYTRHLSRVVEKYEPAPHDRNALADPTSRGPAA